MLWKLKPILDNTECWTGEKIGKHLEVQPGASANYEVTYYPLCMTSEKVKHKYVQEQQERKTTNLFFRGSLFFALPDGGSLIFELIGISLPPTSSGDISKKIPCKVNHVEELTVKNWLKVPQRFKVF